MDQKIAVLFMPDNIACTEEKTPLMLQPIMFCPVLTWMCAELCGRGIERLFIVSDVSAQERMKPYLPKEADVTFVDGAKHAEELLKLLEGSEVEVPVGANSKNAMVPMVTVNTRNILFICGGAFPELENIIKERLNKQASIGFYADLKDKYDNDPHLLEKVTVEDIRNFGMIPEFIGRLPIIFTLDGLTEDMLVKILQEPKNAILKQYQKLLALDEVKLEFEDGALHAIAAKALERDTGARALRAILEEYMLDIMYEIPKDDSIGEVVITREYIEGNGGPRILLRGQEPILLEGSH